MKLKPYYALFCIFIISVINNSKAQNLPTPIIKYLFNGNLNDSSGNNLHAIGTNVDLVQDRQGNPNSAYYFSGNTNSYVVFPCDSFINRNTYTYSLWVKVDTISFGGMTIMSIGGAHNNNAGDGFEQSVSFLSSSRQFFGGSYNVGSNPTQSKVYSEPKLKGKWYHIIVSRDLNNIRMYINGQRVTYQVNQSNTNNQNANYGTAISKRGVIGNIARLNDYPFKGTIDDVNLYTTAFTDSQALKLYNSFISVQEDTTIQPIVKLLFNKNLLDSSGFSNHTIANNGAVFIKDRYGKDSSAMFFDGIDDHIIFPHDSFINLNAYTYSAWVKADLNSGNAMTIMSVGGASNLNPGDGFEQSVSWVHELNANRLFGGSYSYNSNIVQSKIYSNPVEKGEWYHVTFTRDSSNVKLYVNGVQVQSMSTDSVKGSTAHYGLVSQKRAVIGSIARLDTYFFKGIIDDVIIYKKPLSVTQVDKLYKSFKPFKTTLVSIDIDEPILDVKFNKSLNDSSKYNFNFNSSNIQFASDRFGNDSSAIQINGSITNLEYDLDTLKPKQLTVSMWVLADTNIRFGSDIFSIGTNNNPLGLQESMHYTINKGDRFSVHATDNVTSYKQSTTNNFIDRRKWHHVVMTKDSSTYTIYIDGDVQSIFGDNSVNHPSITYGTSNLKFRLKTNPFNSSLSSFYGKVDDILVYQKSLTANEIKNLYNSYNSIPVVAPATQHNQPILNMKFSGNTLDSSGFNNHGVSFGASLTTDRFGQSNSAYEFDGVNDYIKIKENMLVGLNEYTYSIWAYVDQDNNDFANTMFSVGGAHNSQAGDGFEQSISFVNSGSTSGNRFFVGSYNEFGASIVQSRIYSDYFIEKGKWYNITLTRDSQEVSMYINGIAEQKDSLSFVYKYVASYGSALNKNAIVGAIARLDQYYFRGKVDDILVYNRKLSSTEVDSIYNSTKPTSVNLTKNELFSIYPNPSSDEFRIKIKKDLADDYEYKIYNNIGEIIISSDIKSAITLINTKELAAGMYIIELTNRNSNNNYREKIVINK